MAPSSSSPSPLGWMLNFILAPVKTWQLYWLYQKLGGPEQVELLKQIADAGDLIDSGKSERALAACDGIVRSHEWVFASKGTKAFLYATRATAHLHLNNFDKAMSEAKLALEADPQSSHAYAVLGEGLLKTDKHQQAKEAFDKGLAIEPKNLQMLVNRAAAWLHMEQALQGLDDAKRALEIDPKCATALVNMGSAHLKLGNLEEALRISDQALQVSPNNVSAYINKATALQRLERAQESLESYNLAVEHGKGTVAALASRASALIKLKQYDKALEDCKTVLTHSPHNPVALLNEGLALRGVGRPEEAQSVYQAALPHLSLRSHLVTYNCNMAIFAVDMGDFAGAVQHCNSALAIDPANSTSYNNRAWARANVGEYTEALKDAEHACSLRPSACNLSTRGTAFLGLGKLQDALNDLNKALELDPQDSSTYFFRAATLALLDEKERAEQDYARAEELGFKLPKSSVFGSL